MFARRINQCSGLIEENTQCWCHSEHGLTNVSSFFFKLALRDFFFLYHLGSVEETVNTKLTCQTCWWTVIYTTSRYRATLSFDLYLCLPDECKSNIHCAFSSGLVDTKIWALSKRWDGTSKVMCCKNQNRELNDAKMLVERKGTLRLRHYEQRYTFHIDWVVI